MVNTNGLLKKELYLWDYLQDPPLGLHSILQDTEQGQKLHNKMAFSGTPALLPGHSHGRYVPYPAKHLTLDRNRWWKSSQTQRCSRPILLLHLHCSQFFGSCGGGCGKAGSAGVWQHWLCEEAPESMLPLSLYMSHIMTWGCSRNWDIHMVSNSELTISCSSGDCGLFPLISIVTGFWPFIYLSVSEY